MLLQYVLKAKIIGIVKSGIVVTILLQEQSLHKATDKLVDVAASRSKLSKTGLIK